VRIRLFRGSAEVQTAHRQPIIGTPWLVPEPRTWIRTIGALEGAKIAWLHHWLARRVSVPAALMLV
jgi:hypothetical protein